MIGQGNHLALRAARRLVREGYPSQNILYATFDHPLLKLAGLQNALQAWDALYQARPERPRLLFLNERTWSTA